MNNKDRTVTLPANLTAENGAKALLMGEFYERVESPCHCIASDEDDLDPDCPTCNGTGEVIREVPVSWTTIKSIYQRIVQNFGDPGKELVEVGQAQPFDLTWVAKAAHQGDPGKRPEKQLLYSDGHGNLIATDGQRMHIAPTTLPHGYYSPQGEPVEDPARGLPDHQNTIQKFGCAGSREMSFADVSVIDRGDEGTRKYLIPGGCIVNAGHFDEATNGTDHFRACISEKQPQGHHLMRLEMGEAVAILVARVAVAT